MSDVSLQGSFGGKIQGADGSQAIEAGYVGEIKNFTQLATTITHPTLNVNAGSIVLDKGHYEIKARFSVKRNTAVLDSDPYFGCSLSTTSATPDYPTEAFLHIQSSGVRSLLFSTYLTVSSDNSTYYLVTRAGITGGTLNIAESIYGMTLTARRIA